MLKASIGEWTYILLFCMLYATIANIESRLFPVENSIASAIRKEVDFRVNKLGELHNCENMALEAHKRKGRLVWVWYSNEQTHEYWCGALDPETMTVARLKELAPHIRVLNSDRNIRRIVQHESNKHISGSENLRQAAER